MRTRSADLFPAIAVLASTIAAAEEADSILALAVTFAVDPTVVVSLLETISEATIAASLLAMGFATIVEIAAPVEEVLLLVPKE
ncbi:MAG: hypothetical protein AAB967_03665 [Patescibacteria group bacterium]